MQTRQSLSPAVRLTIAGLVGNAVGIWIQALSGAASYAAYPIMPPGPIILVIVAIVVAALRRWWWTPLLGGLLSAWISVGAIVLPETAQRLGNPAAVGEFLGTVLQVVSLALATVAGIVATVQNFLRRRTA